MLGRSSIRSKLMLLLTFLIAGAIVNAFVGALGLSRLRTSYERFHDVGFRLSKEASELQVHTYKLRGDVYKLMAIPDETVATSADIEKDLARIDSSLGNLAGMTGILSDSASESVKEVQELSAAYRAAVLAIVAKTAEGDAEFGRTSMKSGDAHNARKVFDASLKELLAISSAEVTSIDDEILAAASRARTWLLLVALGVLAFALAGGTVLLRQIIGPIQALSLDIDRLGEGDFRASSNDWKESSKEIAGMARSIDRARDMLRNAIGMMSKTAMEGVESSEGQSEMTLTLTHEARSNEMEAQSSAAAAEEASSTIKGISISANNSMERLESVSAAIEEMSATVTEIAGGAERTRNMTNSALDGARLASARMDDLSKASNEIRKVVEMIVEISEQTKLLALNATIEAARAGDAGKGFAVVAGEVKELAKGASEATEEIRKRVDAIQITTNNAVEEIAKVSKNMNELGQSITTIASAVEEQSVTTREIARNVNDAVQETRDIQRNMETGSSTVSLIAKDIQGILVRGKTLLNIANTAKEMSERTARHAGRLGDEVAKFRL